MDAELAQVHAKLKKIRSRTDLSLRKCKYIKPTFTGFDGEEHPFAFRYYQVQGILHMMAMRRFILGDDCGLGKTPMTIGTLCYIWEKEPDRKAIVLTNKSAVRQWAKEFQKFTQGIRVLICTGTPQRRKAIYKRFRSATGPTVMIAGYRSMVRDMSIIQDWSDDVVIFDECTAFKNPSTQVHQVCRHMASRANRVYGLSATIIKNNLMEGYGIYKVIVPALFGAKNRFMLQYCIVEYQRIKGNRKIPIVVGYHGHQIKDFKEKIDPYFLGRPKFEVASELPTLTTRTVPVGLTADQKAKYEEALSGLLLLGEGTQDEEEREVSKLTSIIYCQQIVDHLSLIDCPGESDKLDTLLDLLTNGDFADEQVIVFTRFRKMVDYLMPILKKEGIKAVRITGSENEAQRQAAQDAFQDPKDDTRVIVITTAGGEAINLQAAKAVIFYDTLWSGGDYIQILGRMIRIGSIHDRCYAVHLVAKGTVDQRVMEVLKKKMNLIESVLGKRIKGDGDATVTIQKDNDISDLFAALQNDARAL
jgi:SNF2 family DNA or RNA helicase